MKKERKTIIRFLLTGGLLLFWSFVPVHGSVQFSGYLAVYLLIGWDVLREVGEHILHGSIFDENFLMVIATIGAFGIKEYAEAVFVMLFFRLGEWLETMAVERSRHNIAALMELCPDQAAVEEGGTLTMTASEAVQPGDIIVVKAGERIPLDGIVLSGVSALDTSMMTGESMPRMVRIGDAVFSGCVNQTGRLRIRVSKPARESTASKILELVDRSAERKSRSEAFIKVFARWYTPCVVAAAAVVFLVPTVLFGEWEEWMHRALIFLVISCPCAVVISVPLTYFGGIGGASKQGILIKGSNFMDVLAHTRIAVFDKTGTLTEGAFSVKEILPRRMNPSELLELAALAECDSNHPAAKSVLAAYGRDVSRTRIGKLEELAGCGVRAVVDGRQVLVGNRALMKRFRISMPEAEECETVLYVSVDGEYEGKILMADRLKSDAADAIHMLRQAGVQKLILLSGDRRETAEAVAEELGLDEVHAELLPGEKEAQIERLLDGRRSGERLIFIGDGMNDAPALARADAGIAMGGLGADAAVEAADVVIMDDRPSKVALSIRIAQRTRTIAIENIVFALSAKGVFLLLGALGIASLWEAAFADVGVMAVAVLNAMRTLR